LSQGVFHSSSGFLSFLVDFSERGGGSNNRFFNPRPAEPLLYPVILSQGILWSSPRCHVSESFILGKVSRHGFRGVSRMETPSFPIPTRKPTRQRQPDNLFTCQPNNLFICVFRAIRGRLPFVTAAALHCHPETFCFPDKILRRKKT